MKKTKKKHTFLRLMLYMSSSRIKLVSVTFILVVMTLAGMFAPKVVEYLTDGLQNGLWKSAFSWEFPGKELLALAALYLISGITSGASRHLLVDMAENTVFSMREKMQRKLEVLPLNYIDTHKRGDILARATGDMVTLTNVLETNLPAVFTNLLTIIGTVAMMMVTNIRLSLIFFVMMPLSILSMRIISANAKKLFKKQQEAEGELNAHIEECLTGNEAMRAFNYEEEAYRQLETINVKFFRTYVRSRALSGLFSPIMTLLNNLVYIALCVFGAQAILKGTLTVGGLGAFLIYANNISGPINHFSAMLNQVQAGLAAAERVFEVLDEEPETPDNPETSVQMDETKGIVDFEHVKFGYTPKNILMHDVSFHVDSGQIFAIVGPSGAGKTTLVNLLMRFYEINGGTISLDGNPISELTRGGLRKFTGMVLQDTWIFSGTIYENIAYGKPGATQEEVMAAAKKAQCDEFIRKLPDGYETVISAESSALSMGEKQLLSIARVVIAEPRILILDEATSNIDTRTEVLITKAMSDMMKGKTAFIIAHRLFTIKNADCIIFMKDGDILEVGNHRELMEKGGYYAELYNSSYA